MKRIEVKPFTLICLIAISFTRQVKVVTASDQSNTPNMDENCYPEGFCPHHYRTDDGTSLSARSGRIIRIASSYPTTVIKTYQSKRRPIKYRISKSIYYKGEPSVYLNKPITIVSRTIENSDDSPATQNNEIRETYYIRSPLDTEPVNTSKDEYIIPETDLNEGETQYLEEGLPMILKETDILEGDSTLGGETYFTDGVSRRCLPDDNECINEEINMHDRSDMIQNVDPARRVGLPGGMIGPYGGVILPKGTGITGETGFVGNTRPHLGAGLRSGVGGLYGVGSSIGAGYSSPIGSDINGNVGILRSTEGTGYGPAFANGFGYGGVIGPDFGTSLPGFGMYRRSNVAEKINSGGVNDLTRKIGTHGGIHNYHHINTLIYPDVHRRSIDYTMTGQAEIHETADTVRENSHSRRRGGIYGKIGIRGGAVKYGRSTPYGAASSHGVGLYGGVGFGDRLDDGLGSDYGSNVFRKASSSGPPNNNADEPFVDGKIIVDPNPKNKTDIVKQK